MEKNSKVILIKIVIGLIFLIGITCIALQNFPMTSCAIGGGGNDCTDTDNGDNPSTSGTCQDSTDGYPDKCSGEVLTEYYCISGETGSFCRSTTYNCSSLGKICVNGACVEPPKCSDGTPVNSCSSTKPLYCNSNLELVENCTICGCEIGTCNQTTLKCEGGCVSTDKTENSDYDFHIAGNSTLGNTIWKDSCINSTTLNETYCSSGELKYLIYTCNLSAGEVCIDGACVAQQNCSDSDGGIEPAILGNCTDKNGIYTDECSSLKKVKEYFCNSSSNLCEYTEIGCGSGEICSEGKCKRGYNGSQPPSPPPFSELNQTEDENEVNYDTAPAQSGESSGGLSSDIFAKVVGIGFIISGIILIKVGISKRKKEKLDQANPIPYSY